MTDWTWAVASCRGLSHIQANEGRQDAFRVVTADAGFLVAIACDGAGSASQGRAGAVIAARSLSAQAKEWISRNSDLPEPETVRQWFDNARFRVTLNAVKIGYRSADFATTVVLAISDGQSTITAHIGDGAIVTRRAGTAIFETLSWPEHGDYVSTTYFLTDSFPRVRIGVLRDVPIDRLALLTDGLERLALDFRTHTSHAPFFAGMFGAIAGSHMAGRDQPLSDQLAAFLDSDAVNARTDDDKTLILAVFK